MPSPEVSPIDLSPQSIELWRQNIRGSTFANYHLEMGVALEREGSISNALSSYRKAVDLQPHWLEAQVRLIRLLKANGQDSNAAEQAALRVSTHYFANGLAIMAFRQLKAQDHNGALRLALEAMEMGAGLPCVQSAMAVALSFVGRTEEARKQARAVQPPPPSMLDDLSDNVANLAQSLIGQQQWSRALPCLETLARLDPDNMDMAEHLAWAYIVAGEWPYATEALRYHLARHPDDSAREIDLAQVLHAQGAYDEARICYQRVASKSDDAYQPRGWIGLSLLAIAAGRPQEAITLLKTPLGDAESVWWQKNPIASSTMALALIQTGDINDAERWMEAAFQMAEENDWVFSSMAMLRLIQGRREEAIALLRRASSLSPQLAKFTAYLRPWALADLASAYEAAGIVFRS